MKIKTLSSLIVMLVILLTSLTFISFASEGGGTKLNPLASTDEELAVLERSASGDYKYKLEDFSTKPDKFSFHISPNGKYISYLQLKEGVYSILIQDLLTDTVETVVSVKGTSIKKYSWLSDSTILYSRDNQGDEQYHQFVVNIDGTGNKDITPFENSRSELFKVIDENTIIIQSTKDNPAVPKGYRINIDSGDVTSIYNGEFSDSVETYIIDNTGILRGFALFDESDLVVYYESANGEYKQIKRGVWYESFEVIEFDTTTEYPHDAYVASSIDNDKITIYLYDLQANKVIRKLFSNDTYDLEKSLIISKIRSEIDAYSFYGEKHTIVPVSKTFKKINNLLSSKFPNSTYRIDGITTDEAIYLIFVQDAKLSQRYFIYNSNSNQLKELYNLRPNFDPKDMAEIRPIQYKSRDGLTIHGYLTIPNPKSIENRDSIPLIVVPHGGPQDTRDTWVDEAWTEQFQLLASRGYAVVNMNFRISSGYGKAFRAAGFKQVGRKTIDDIIDGIDYVLSEYSFLDVDRIGIYGASHGGYASLISPIRYPDYFQCAVSYVGVTDIADIQASLQPYWVGRPEVTEVWYDLNNPEEAEIAKNVSPITHADSINIPIYIVQGANDPRVKMSNSDIIVKALRDKGVDVPYMVKYNEGHGFSQPDNKLHLYRTMIGFFNKCLKK